MANALASALGGIVDTEECLVPVPVGSGKLNELLNRHLQSMGQPRVTACAARDCDDRMRQDQKEASGARVANPAPRFDSSSHMRAFCRVWGRPRYLVRTPVPGSERPSGRWIGFILATTGNHFDRCLAPFFALRTADSEVDTWIAATALAHGPTMLGRDIISMPTKASNRDLAIGNASSGAV